ncbi:MAG TPA: serine/threonine-protein kinase [Planctomycetaceae bacterium]|jgi:WD40 repeat protein/serine/threonine protein kinase|nr:serine/threonine-protein kinase [Planctomycetaceae bacterium]
MSMPSQPILPDADSDETFVRRSFVRLERGLREVALACLGEWQQCGVVTPAIFEAAAGLKRPSWGTWDGILDRLLRARQDVLGSGSAEERSAVERLSLLPRIASSMKQPAVDPLPVAVRAIARLTGAQAPGRITMRHVLKAPISLRNRIEHDGYSEANEWKAAADALRPLIGSLAKDDPLGPTLSREVYRSPWFLLEGDEVWSFNGLPTDDVARYLARSGAKRDSAEEVGAVLLAVQSLLGKTDIQERNFHRLLARLAPDEVKGVLLDDYLVGPPVGSGGFAVVHAGRELSTGRKVAIKILRDGSSEDDRARFEHESTYLSKINHAHVVQVYNSGRAPWLRPRNAGPSDEPWFQEFVRSAPEKSFLVLEWIDGKTLDEVFRSGESERPTFDTVLRWFFEAATALAAVHAAGLVHRDVKPSNIMLAADEKVRLMDFGIARSQSETRTLVTALGERPGTWEYMAPEQLQTAAGKSEVGPSADLYSLCATFYELFTGTRLYGHDHVGREAVIQRKLSGERPPIPSGLARKLPWEIRTLLLGGLECAASDRPASMQDLASDLERVRKDMPIRYRPTSRVRRMRLAYRRNRTIFNLVAVFAVALTVGAGFYEHERDVNQVARQSALHKAALGDAIAGNYDAAHHSLREANAPLDDPLRSRVWRMASTRIGQPRELPLGGNPTRWAAYGAAGPTLATCGHDNAIRLWDLATQKTIGLAMVEEDLILGVASSRDGRLLATGSGDSTVGAARLWDATKQKQIGSALRHEMAVNAVAFSPDGRTLLTGSEDKTARLWDTQTGKLVGNLIHDGPVRSVAFSPDPKVRTVLTGTGPAGSLERATPDYSARLWDVATQKRIGQPMRHKNSVTCLAFSPDGRTILTGSEDKAAQLWDVATQRPIGTALHHEMAVDAVAFSPDGATVLTGSRDNTAQLWATDRLWADVPYPAAEDLSRMWEIAGKPIGQPMRHENSVTCVAYSPDGLSLLTVSGGTVRLWPLLPPTPDAP